MVNNGYKKTEIGLIPEDWELCSIEHNFDFYQNNTYSRDCMNDVSGTVCNIHYGDVLIKYGAILECDKEDIPFINPEISVNTINRTIQSGDIIMSDTAEDETVGKAVEVVNVGNKTIVAGLHTFFIRPHANLFAQRYLGYFINSPVYHDQLLPHIVGTKVSSISKKSLAETFVLRPPIPEQEAIAKALSDIDNLIANLEKLIAKKKAVKKGAMQELLTGKKHLPGFNSEWVEKPLEDISIEIIMGQSPDSQNYNDQRIGLPLIQGNADINNRQTIIRYFTKEVTRIGKSGDIILTVRAPVGNVAKTYFDCCLGRGVCAIRGNEFLYQLLVLFEPCWANISTGSTFDSISSDELKAVNFLIPTDENEQSAIASILSDMDNEISEIEEKLSKYRNIKIGMMQTLLTGQIRLYNQDTI
jgi:type I restriction enzyme S subunit